MKDEITELNYQFKEQIRRKKIDELFSKRRKEMLSELSSDIESSNKLSQTNEQLLGQIHRQIEENSNNLNLQILKSMAKLSIDPNTIKGINNAIIINLLSAYLDEKYIPTNQQYFATFVLCNLFCINNNKEIVSQEFIQKLFLAAINSSPKTRENCMAILFHIIHDSEPVFIDMLIHKSSLNVISFLFHQMRSEPSVSVVQETLRCYYILMKKTNFPKIEAFAKLRQFIFCIIKSSNNFQVVYMATMCLSGLLQCLPDERDLSKSGILKALGDKVISSGNENLAMLVVKLCETCIPKSPQQQIKNVIFPFLFDLLKLFDNHSISIKVYKLICSLAFNHKSYIGFILQKNFSIFEKMLEILQNSIDRQLVTEVSNCICLFLLNVKYIPANVRVRAQEVLKKILEKNQLSEGSLEFIQQMLDCTTLN